MPHDRKTIQNVYIRVCKDSGYTLDNIRATILTGAILGIAPLLIYAQFSGFDVMEQIAAGTHPACVKEN